MPELENGDYSPEIDPIKLEKVAAKMRKRHASGILSRQRQLRQAKMLRRRIRR